MALDLLPYSEWAAGTLQNSVPANTNALRSEVLAAHVISDSITAQPGTPGDGDCYIIPTGRTGAQWATFDVGSLAYFRGGTWYEFTAYEGLLKVVGAALKLYTSSAWTAYGGGGFSNPMTTSGDIIVGGSGGAATRLPIGAEGRVLKVSSGALVYAEESGGGGPEFIPGAQSVMELRAADNSSSFSVLGYSGQPTGVGGSASAISTTTTNAGTATPRIAYGVGVPSPTAVAGARMGNGSCFIGSGTAGGFSFAGGWLVAQGAPTASHRVFCGLQNANVSPTDVDPSTLLNILGFGYDAADTTVQFFHNDGSGTATKVNTGIPKPTTNSSAAYRIRISCSAGGSVSYSIKELVAGTEFSGTASTDLPSATTTLRYNSYMSAGGTSTSVSIHLFGHAITIP